MKNLLKGVAIAAALAVVAPVWALAQTPAAQGSKPAPAMSAAAPMAPMGQRHKRMHHMGRAKTGPGDASTEQLNREELARLQGGSAMPPAAPPPPQALQGPRSSGK